MLVFIAFLAFNPVPQSRHLAIEVRHHHQVQDLQPDWWNCPTVSSTARRNTVKLALHVSQELQALVQVAPHAKTLDASVEPYNIL